MVSVASMLGLLFRSFPQLERSKFAIDVSVCGLLAFFGLRSIYEALYDDKIDRGDSIVAENVIKNESLSNNGWSWSVFWKIFYLILSAELGDRSFMSTFALSSTSNPVHILLGTVCAHLATTIIAVNGGKVLLNM
jgi:putative Ca2+/H+ antiporter (TMEM165/GDT1 family)